MTPDPPSAARVGIETHGVDTIPEADRTGRPRDVAGILLGSTMCLGVVIFGCLPASFWPAVTSMIAGTLLGTLLARVHRRRDRIRQALRGGDPGGREVRS